MLLSTLRTPHLLCVTNVAHQLLHRHRLLICEKVALGGKAADVHQDVGVG